MISVYGYVLARASPSAFLVRSVYAHTVIIQLRMSEYGVVVTSRPVQPSPRLSGRSFSVHGRTDQTIGVRPDLTCLLGSTSHFFIPTWMLRLTRLLYHYHPARGPGCFYYDYENTLPKNIYNTRVILNYLSLGTVINETTIIFIVRGEDSYGN